MVVEQHTEQVGREGEPQHVIQVMEVVTECQQGVQ
jgi:hypothetical protein